MGTWKPSSNLACTYSQSAPNWLMDSGIQHHLRSDLDNLAIQLEYHGLEEVTLGNGSKFPISHIGKGSPPISDKSHALDNLFHVPIASQNLLSISSFTNSKQVSIDFFPNYFLIKALAMRAVIDKGPNDGGLYSLSILKSVSSPASYVAPLGV